MGEKMKFADWETRLQRHIEAQRDRVFKWGEFDCCTFAAGAVQAQTGRDIMPDWDYAQKPRTIARLMRNLEHVVIEVVLRQRLPEVPVLCAQRGDLVMGRTDKGRAFMAVVGLDGWNCWAAGPVGLTAVPLDEMFHAWRIE
jgi:hypothetical protein